MSQPIFVVGPQRSGTSILARTICQAEGVANRHFSPCPRWDIPAMAELGGQVRETPWLDRMDAWVARQTERYAVVRFALPWAVESFGWPRLAEGRPEARFVYIYRNPQDTFDSYRSLAYLPSMASKTTLQAYWDWHFYLYQTHSERRLVFVYYDGLVMEGVTALKPMWAEFGLEPPTLPDGWFHKPKHWSGDRT